MAENKIEIKSIRDLLEMNFFIPAYQRGYRWTAQQVKDLLEDIQEFIDKEQNKRQEQKDFYCIQPLVVKELEQEIFKLIKEEARNLNEIKNLLKGRWEVVDGQQRLTTIYILLSYLNKTPNSTLNSTENYSIEYATRKGSKCFLANIEKCEKEKDNNIDYYHMVVASRTIANWFDNKNDDSRMNFKNNLLENVKFIWYESDKEEDAIKIFTRLNIGKIALTNAELIKALFLNRSNFQDSPNYHKIRLQQQEIASEWDRIEYTLQNDEFWLFLNEAEYEKPTRIDFIFDLMCEKNILELEGACQGKTGKDEYRTFRYFYLWFNDGEHRNKMADCWKKVKKFFQTFQEWFNDLELYHYVGFLVEHKTEISSIIDNWNKSSSKQEFLEGYIIFEIRKILSDFKDLERQYENDGPAKTQCRPILLLHNIKTIINQNKTLVNDEKYKLPVFYKFPFHLFKKETWDVEHIDSHTENPLDNLKDQKEWLKQSYDFVGESQNGIKEFLEKYKTNENKDESKQKFEELHKEIVRSNAKDKLNDEEKDRLWNFCLLDSSTNRSYGNAIFPAKRRVIIGKSQGKKIKLEDDFSVKEEPGIIAFIPPCTEKVFQKSFNPMSANLREWDKKDAEAYLRNIKETLGKFLVGDK